MAGGRHPIPIDRPMRQYRISRSGGRGDSAIGIGRRRRPTAQADGTGRRRRPTAQADGTGRRSSPTELADGAGRRRRPTEQADGARRRSSPTELADGARRRQQPTEVADGACRRRLCTLDIQIRGCKCTTFAAQAVPVLDRVGLAWRRQHPIRGCDRRLAWAGSAGCGHAVKCWPTGDRLCFDKPHCITPTPLS